MAVDSAAASVWWTFWGDYHPAFTVPSGQRRTAPQVMRQAFATAVAHLSSALGGAPASWPWGRLHARAFPALSGTAGLGYGPRPAGGDPFTPDAADGGLTATAGPSWRPFVTGIAAGLPPHAAVGVAATLLVGLLQALAALWLTRALTFRLRHPS